MHIYLLTCRAQLLFTDTDSLVYSISTEDLYADMALKIDTYYDTSDYPVGHHLRSMKNAKTVGFFKDELNGTPIVEFVGLRAKMYSFLLPDGSSKRTAKGIKESFKRKHIVHADYRECLLDEKMTRAQFVTIRSFDHSLVTIQTDKIALSPFDDKRFLLDSRAKLWLMGTTKLKMVRQSK